MVVYGTSLFQIVSIFVLCCEFFYVKHLREPLKKIDPDGACGLISMVSGGEPVRDIGGLSVVGFRQWFL